MKFKPKCSFTTCAYIAPLLSTLLLPYSVNIHAEELPQGFSFQIDGTIASDDNLFKRSDEVSDEYLLVSPKVTAVNYFGKHSVNASYVGSYTKFNEHSDVNYNEHSASLGVELDHSNKLSSTFNIQYNDIVEQPGSTNAASLLISEYNDVENINAEANIIIGQQDSIGQLIFSYGYSDFNYINNAQSYRDYTSNTLITTFYYRIVPNTRLLFEASFADYDYVESLEFNDQSSQQMVYFAGVQWEASAKVAGTFKIGYQDKDYNQDLFNDLSGLSYFLDMTWRPTPHTDVQIGLNRRTTESAEANIGGFISNTYSINVNHEITERTLGVARLSLSEDNISSEQSRTDNRYIVSLGIKHSLRVWLSANLAYEYSERSSDNNLFEFESNAIRLSLNATF